MFYVYKQSESVALRRQVYFHLVDATDGITPETGETGGQPQISKNGAAFGSTTNTLVAIGNGSYYCELTAAELSDFGFIMVRFKSANTAEYQILAQVIADDPYIVHGVGGIVAGGSGKSGQFNPKMAQDIAERVWKVKLENEKTAAETLLSKSEFDAAKDPVLVDHSAMEKSIEIVAQGLQSLIEKDLGTDSIISAIEGIELKDYGPDMERVGKDLSTRMQQEFKSLAEAVRSSIPNLKVLETELVGLMPLVKSSTVNTSEFQTKLADLQKQFVDVEKFMQDFSKRADQHLDIEKRFTSLSNKMNESTLQKIVEEVTALEKELREQMKNLRLAIVNIKYEEVK
jgi:hypothetical protein